MGDEKRGRENFGGSFEKEASQILRANEKKAGSKLGVSCKWPGGKKLGRVKSGER